jgi:hypothetical protein
MAVVNNLIFFQRGCVRECNYDIEPAGGRKRAAARRTKSGAGGAQRQKCILNYVCVRAAEILGHCKLIKKHHTALACGRK